MNPAPLLTSAAALDSGARPADSARSEGVTRSTEAHRVFDGVVSDILSGAIHPRQHLSERDLVARFGVSRTPVREAIKRLFDRGLIEPGPKGVAVVVQTSFEDLQKLYDLRLELEGSAALATAANITPQEIAALRELNMEFGAALAERDLVRMLETRAAFHKVAVRATRNRWLAEVLVTLRDRSYVVRHVQWREVDRAAQTLQIQQQMIDALERGDAASYRKSVLHHVRSALDSYNRQLRAPSGDGVRMRKPQKIGT